MAYGESYEDFVNKFKPKKTTDDCYTPPEVYEVVKDYAVEKYGIDEDKIVRPFYPGGDYEGFDYSGGKVVVDNPPFSIATKIYDFYIEKGIPFFLFANGKTLVGQLCNRRITVILANKTISYSNGACVHSAFCTNLGEPRIIIDPDLGERIEEAQEGDKEPVLAYDYPDHVLTFGQLTAIARRGQYIEIPLDETYFIRELDNQKPYKKGIYGAGLLLSDKQAEKVRKAKEADIPKGKERVK